MSFFSASDCVVSNDSYRFAPTYHLGLPGVGGQVDDETSIYNMLIVFFMLIGVFSVVNGLIFNDVAAYGRHTTQKDIAFYWTIFPEVPGRVAWLLMESPSALLFAYFFATGIFRANTQREHLLVPLYLLLLWEVHYIHRTFVYPFYVMKNPGGMSSLVLVFGMISNVLNSYLCATFITRMGIYTTEYFYDPRLIVGTLIYTMGCYVNRKADAMLSKLREESNVKVTSADVVTSDTRKYKIPHGFLYEYVSCPNYLGEILIWLGWAVASWSSAGFGFFVFTCGNLITRAIQNHRWYKDKFKSYPKNRKAIFPFIL